MTISKIEHGSNTTSLIIKNKEYLLQDFGNSLFFLELLNLLDIVFGFFGLKATQQMYNSASKHTPNVSNSNISFFRGSFLHLILVQFLEF